MLSLAADENFDGRIVRGLFRILPDLDLIRVQDTPLLQAEDAWARIRAGLPMPGLIEVSSEEPLGQVIEEISLIVATSKPGEYEGQVLFLPL